MAAIVPHDNAAMTTHHPRRSAEEQAKLHAALTELHEQRITFHTVLGLRVVSLAPEAPQCAFQMRPELVGHFLYGRLHGGVIASVLDSMGGFALMVAMGERHADESADQILHRFARMGTIDLRVDYLRPAIGERFTASAEVLRLGGRVGSTQMRLHGEDGTLLATGSAAYILS